MTSFEMVSEQLGQVNLFFPFICNDYFNDTGSFLSYSF